MSPENGDKPERVRKPDSFGKRDVSVRSRSERALVRYRGFRKKAPTWSGGRAETEKFQQAADRCNPQTLLNEAKPNAAAKRKEAEPSAQEKRATADPALERGKSWAEGANPRRPAPGGLLRMQLRSQSQACRVPNGMSSVRRAPRIARDEAAEEPRRS